MREQAIPQKVGGRAGLANKRTGPQAQRPARRGGRTSAATFGDRVRALARYLPSVTKVVLAITLGALIFAGYRAAASATFFQVRHVEVKGTSRASADQIQQLVRHDLAPLGVWRADLTAVSAQLERLPWVRTAVVTRLLPDGIRVRVTERVPRAVVRTAAGRLIWVDDDAVVLGEMSPADQLPTFFMRGWSEENSETARLDNRERVKKYLDLAHDWDAAGISERVSEVNLIDVRDIRAQLAGDDSEIEVRLGSKDPGPRLQKALSVLDSQRETPRGGLISYVDLTQGKRAVVGFTSGKQVSSESTQAGAAGDNESPTREPDTHAPKPARIDKPTKDNRAAKDKTAKNQNRPRTD
ncbi:MAG: Polypeptide-transport-associated domain protein FtsQ-type [Acidobacteria bacterium]|nr:Polypeptide-transport-associated domain protein FtsQ-type [Acidobacteriota bacterium]